MGLFIHDDPYEAQNENPTGFYLYRQLLGSRFGRWWKVHLLTLIGFLPLAAGIFYAVGRSSILLLLPISFAGGMIAGPFLAGLYDAILRGLRGDATPWKDAYVRAWKQDWTGSLLPGALLGLMLGLYAFMGMLFWWAETPPSLGTIVLYLFSLLLVLVFNSLYWPQLVLFDQRTGIRLRNCLLFCIRYFWRVMGIGLIQLAYWAFYVLFAPWTLLLMPFIGAWYIVFLSQFLIYRQMDTEFQIAEQFEKSQQ